MLRASGVYQGWVGHENLGDEVMWQVCRTCFPSIQWSIMNTLSAGIGQDAVSRMVREPAWVWRVAREELHDGSRTRLVLKKWRHRLRSVLAGEVGLLGGGTLINRNEAVLREYVTLRRRLKRPIPVFGTGVANYGYWNKTSGWVDLRKEWVQVLQELPVIGVRGPQSRQELEDAGLRNVIVCGDPAVMMHEPLGPHLPTSDRLTIGINFGMPVGGTQGAFDEIEQRLAAIAKDTALKHTVRVLPVWTRDVSACQRLARRADLPVSSVTLPLTTYEAFQTEIGTVDFLIAFKLHAAILAAVNNVPFVLIEYQPKCRDFLASAGCERYGLDPRDFNAEVLAEHVARASLAGNDWRSEICRKMCELSHRFDAYCTRIAPLLTENARASD